MLGHLIWFMNVKSCHFKFRYNFYVCPFNIFKRFIIQMGFFFNVFGSLLLVEYMGEISQYNNTILSDDADLYTLSQLYIIENVSICHLVKRFSKLSYKYL